MLKQHGVGGDETRGCVKCRNVVALKIWTRLCCKLDVRVQLLYIETRSNRIWDELSRKDWSKALNEVGEEEWECRTRALSAIMAGWEEELFTDLCRTRLFRGNKQEESQCRRQRKELGPSR